MINLYSKMTTVVVIVLVSVLAVNLFAGVAVGATVQTGQPNQPTQSPSMSQPTAPPANQPSTPGANKPASPPANQPASPGAAPPADKPASPPPAETKGPAAEEQKPAETTPPETVYYGSRPLVVRLKYLKADQARGLLTMIVPEDRVKVEPVNNAIVVMAGDYEYEQVRALLAELDVPPRQVMFELEAVEVNRDDVRNLGFDWGSLTAFPDKPVTDGSAFQINFKRGLEGYGTNFKATINRLVENKKGRLLASPRIAALDGQTAQILIGDRLAVENRTIVSGSELISVTYVDVGIKLEITPFVNDDGTITTRIKPEVSNKTDQTKNGNPNIRTRQAETTLRVKDGQTIVLGGLIQRQETRDEFKVPLLGSIPVVGNLFRTVTTEKLETELVILLTPKMVANQ